jgi:hypothetical protein
MIMTVGRVGSGRDPDLERLAAIDRQREGANPCRGGRHAATDLSALKGAAVAPPALTSRPSCANCGPPAADLEAI